MVAVDWLSVLRHFGPDHVFVPVKAQQEQAAGPFFKIYGQCNHTDDEYKGDGSSKEGDEGEDGESAKPAKTTLTAICKCALPRRIQKIARVVFEAATITCDACGEHFTEDRR